MFLVSSFKDKIKNLMLFINQIFYIKIPRNFYYSQDKEKNILFECIFIVQMFIVCIIIENDECALVLNFVDTLELSK